MRLFNYLKMLYRITRIDNKAFNNLKSLIDNKNLISYTGDIYQQKDLVKIRKSFNRFIQWAESIIKY